MFSHGPAGASRLAAAAGRLSVALVLGLALAGLTALAPLAFAAPPGSAAAPGRTAPGAPPPAPSRSPAAGTPTPTATPAASRTPTPTPDRLLPLSPTLAAAEVTFLGDSVMLGAEAALRRRFGPDTVVDGTVSRQYGAGLERLAALRAAGRLGEVLVIHLGNNGLITPRQLAETITLTRGVPHLLLVSVRVPRRWEPAVNGVLRAGAARWPGLRLVDWHRHSLGREGYFTPDGVHLTPSGARAYADLLARAVHGALAGREPEPPPDRDGDQRRFR